MNLQHIKAAILTLDTGEKIHVELIGKGRFSEAWKNGANVYVITREREWGTDYSKEMLYRLDSDNPHIPKVEMIGELSRCRSNVYKMPLYQALEAKHKEAWQQFKELAKLREQAWKEVFIDGREWNKLFNYHLGIMMCQRFCDLVQTSVIVPETLKEALEELTNEISNYGDSWVFEFAKRNLVVDKNGNLVLLDCLFDMEVLEQQRRTRN